MENNNKKPSKAVFVVDCKLLLHALMPNTHLCCQQNHSEVSNLTSLRIFLIIQVKTHQKGKMEGNT